MTPEQWERAKEIFDVALDLAPDKQSAYVRSACSRDPTVFSEVESLLAAHEELLPTQKEAGSSYLRPKWFGEATPPTPSLRNGEVISGRFRIMRQLGKGGMGEVYEAHDSELGVQVALKTLHPEIAANPEVLTRFRQEVRIAHRITHSNVCRTFQFDREIGHIGPDGSNPVDLTFITMEFLDGETLQQILKDTGRLPLERAHSIAVQMAEAIEAAHLTGIIHRDIKPGNVMICPGKNGEQDRVVVTDFGLAKIDLSVATANPELSAISHPGHAIGTLAYMAPEQLEAGTVSPATDVYAFGLVLYEMVTGQKAFPNASTLSTAFRRLNEDPPSPRALVPALPAAWERAILGCLQIDPADRFQHATDVIAVLEGANPVELRKYSVSQHSTRSRRPAPQRQPGTRRRWMLPMGAIVLLCVSLSWPAYRLYQWRANSTVAPGTLVYLAPVKNETGEKQLDNITELVHAGLSQSAHINLLDAGRVGDILQSMSKPVDTPITEPVAREIAMRAGAPRVILTTVTGSGGSYRVNFEIQRPDNTPLRARESWTNSWKWKSPPSSSNIPLEMLAAIRNASDWIRHNVGESRSDIGALNVPPGDVTTGNWNALAEYAAGERLAARGNSEDAVVAFHNATVKDPNFASAYAREGDLLIALDHPLEGYQFYDRALSADLAHRLTRKERDFIKGAYANDTADYTSGDEAFRDLAAYYETDYFGIFFGAFPLRMMGRFQDAIKVLNRAHELNPDAGGPYIGLAYNYMLLRDFDAAQGAIDKLKEVGRSGDAAMLTGHLAFLKGKQVVAETSFENLIHSSNPAERSEGFSFAARLAAEYGNYSKAIEALDTGLAADHSRGDHQFEALKYLDRAYLNYRLGKTISCLDDVRHGVELDARPAYLIRGSAILGSALEKSSLSAAQRDAVITELATLKLKLPANASGVIFDLARFRIHGELLLAHGDAQKALEEFRKADALDSPIKDREYLARALISASATAADKSTAAKPQAMSLLKDALELREHIVTNPQLIWNYSMWYPPGFLADEMQAYLNLAAQLGNRTNSVRQGQETLRLLRSARPSALPLAQ